MLSRLLGMRPGDKISHLFPRVLPPISVGPASRPNTPLLVLLLYGYGFYMVARSSKSSPGGRKQWQEFCEEFHATKIRDLFGVKVLREIFSPEMRKSFGLFEAPCGKPKNKPENNHAHKGRS